MLLIHLFLDCASCWDSPKLYFLIDTVPPSLPQTFYFLQYDASLSYNGGPSRHHPYVPHVKTILIFLS